VLFMSGYAPLNVQAHQQNDTRFLQKPFHLADLTACVRQMLQ
jgi:FixJ family two-component response regulator